MKRILCVLMLIFMASQCAVAQGEVASNEAASLYDLIEMSAVKEELDEMYGSTELEDGYFLYNGEVMLAFYESGRLQGKIRVFENAKEIAPVANIPLDKISSYKQGMTIDEVTSAFAAEGLEIMKINLADEENAGLRRVLVWKTEADVVVQALFEMDDNEWVLFAIAEVK